MLVLHTVYESCMEGGGDSGVFARLKAVANLELSITGVDLVDVAEYVATITLSLPRKSDCWYNIHKR